MLLQGGLNLVPKIPIDDGRVATGIGLALMRDLADVESVRQDLVDMPAREGPSTLPTV